LPGRLAAAAQRRAAADKALKLNMMRQGIPPALETTMTLDEYNKAVKQIVAEQQSIAQTTAQMAMSGKATPGTAQFTEIMTKQWGLVQQMAKLNTDLMMGIMTPKK